MRVFFWGAIFSWVQKCREPVRALDRQIGRIGVKMTSNIKQRMGVRGGSFQLDPMVSNPYLQTVNKQSSPWEKKNDTFPGYLPSKMRWDFLHGHRHEHVVSWCRNPPPPQE